MRARTAALNAEAVATALETWMRSRDAGRTGGPKPPGGTAGTGPEAPGNTGGDDVVRQTLPEAGAPVVRPEQPAALDPEEPAAAADEAVAALAETGPPLAPAHTDWLSHRLCITGPEAVLTVFRTAARGTGVIPWSLDLDRLEEDWFLRLVAPAAPQRRTLSIEGAHVLAGQLREAVARRHARATSPVARARGACPFDLHALVPIPDRVLRLGPDHPSSLAWLWAHWGTTQELRHVAETADAAPGTEKSPALDDTKRLVFWSADWTPWRAFSAIQAQFPALRFDVQPVYDRP